MNRLPSLPDMVLDPGPRGLDAGAVSGDRAFRIAPQLRIDGVLDEARGAAALGGAMQQAGGALHELGVKQLEAVSLRQQADAKQLIATGEMELHGKLATEPDEMKWGDIAAKHMDEVAGRLGKMGMMEGARREVDATLARRRLHVADWVKVESAKESFRRAGQKFEEQADLAIEQRDPALLTSALSTAEQLRYISPERRQLIEAKAKDRWEQMAKKDAIDAGQVQIQANPFDWKPDPKGDPDVNNALASFQRETLNLNALAVRDEISDAMSKGEVRTVDDIERIAAGRVRPSTLDGLKEHWRKGVAVAEREMMLRPENAIPKLNQWNQAVTDADATTDEGRTALLGIDLESEALPDTEAKTLLKKRIRDKMAAAEPDVDTELQSYGLANIRQAHELQQFGRYSTTTGMEGDVLGLVDIPNADKKGPAGWMYEVGLTKEEVEGIAAAPDRPTRVRLFQTAFEAGDRRGKMEKVAKFNIVEREKIARLLSAKDSTKKTVDEAAEARSAKTARDLELQFLQWFQQQKAKGAAPGVEEINAWHYKATNGMRASSAVPSLRATAPVARPVDDQRPPFSALDLDLPDTGGGPSNSLLPDMPAQ